MQAHVGDRLIVESPVTGTMRRDGEIVGLHHEDGTPPYDVRWSDTGETTLVFPGPDAHIQHPGGTQAEWTATPAAPSAPGGRPGPGARVPQPGDIGRRLAAARGRLGLGLAETARRARMSPDYLAYLETHAADPGMATLVRLADALGTTLIELQGADQDRPPGQGHALLHPRLEDLPPQECWTRLSTHGVGRVAVTTADGPAVLPVNYDVVDGAIVYRTAPGSALAAVVGETVAFEADHIDDAMGQGWSVLVVGPARAVTDPDKMTRLGERAHSDPWAGGERGLWVELRPERITGRRITSADE
ncbi:MULTISPECIES: pyridoxamine 5'-phosphate oxidase family protein [unclassified Streptomyces]|uniref:pyridoxamine 5'-phosphate oxidase family protein n=1 Tax=unclassified Streptomyces TaxID=2593676 RepID=UPI001F03575D|nr:MULTISPECIES: pyridoxamine 5'-phosphate oxidase family protein [unclassified Streptomyces]MCH0565735.1 DUF1918 domain-containing protein [Streptomyces sp. MUM 2J]MCH0570584.1 DUF1918 domain-containing protein [Streptomyces sp. MUM 136J]